MTTKTTKPHQHEWVVFSTALKECCLMVQCVECGTIGTVDDPSQKEWQDAFDAPSNPYRWDDESRVTVRFVECRQCYVVRGDQESSLAVAAEPFGSDSRSPLAIIATGKDDQDANARKGDDL
jgi:hypothetical protein